MIAATSIELFKNLTQYDYDNQYYDFHNDYSCEKLSYANGVLLLLFKPLVGRFFLTLKFTDVNIVSMTFFCTKDGSDLTLDSMYRGRVEFSGDLIETSFDGKGYFYLEFYEGQKLEFWAKGISIEKEV